MRREDDAALFYAGKVNVVFGDPEAGKTWIGYAAVAQALKDELRACIFDLDHNGAAEIISRLLLLGAPPSMLRDPERFRLYEPEDKSDLMAMIEEAKAWRPAVAIVDSVGEILPLLGLSSNSPDDYTNADRATLTALARRGAAVIAIDHLPKDEDARHRGQTGTLAKKRTVNGVSLRATCVETFRPGYGGAASLTIHKDRPGGLRAVCPPGRGVGAQQPAGRFVLQANPDGTADWWVTAPHAGDTTDDADDNDVAELDALDPPPKSQRDVCKRLNWGHDRAMAALRTWRETRQQ
jgi:hypothetical protein